MTYNLSLAVKEGKTFGIGQTIHCICGFGLEKHNLSSLIVFVYLWFWFG